jgi:hypothetical protein
MTDPQTPSNPLGVRLSLSKSVTRKTGEGKGEGYDKTIATIESDKPQGVDALEGLRQLDATLSAFLAGDKVQLQPQPNPQPKPAEKAPEKPVEPTKPRLDLSAFNEAKTNSKGGKWLFADKIPELAEKVRAAGYKLDTEGGSLSLSKDGKFLTLWGAKK